MEEVNIAQVKTSSVFLKELREHLEDSLKLAQEELQKSQKCYTKYFDKKDKSKCFEVEDQLLILLPTDSNKSLMQWRGAYIVENRAGENDYRVKIGFKTKTYHVKKYIAKEPEVDVVHTSNKDDATVAVARVFTKILTQSWGSTRLEGLSSERRGPRH